MSPLNTAVEANFDGLVGPTHNYAGLATGNVASLKNAERPSNPRAAALQGLSKMQGLQQMGMLQGVLPPQERPHIPTLKALGFTGNDADVLAKAAREAPHLLAAASSASSMWTANAATVSPSADCSDGRVHFTPANLASHLHRSLETPTTARALAATFKNAQHFVHHAPLPSTPSMGDEGAANHNRLCRAYGDRGVEVFVFGTGGEQKPNHYPARQGKTAGEAIARLHGLSGTHTLHVQQNPSAIDAGVFHNDVIAVANRELLFFHEKAFLDNESARHAIRQALPDTVLWSVPNREISVELAVRSYLFNSQLICPPQQTGHTLVCAQECQEQPAVWRYIQQCVEDRQCPISAVAIFDLKQSMQNGGGPACLRLRVVLNAQEQAAVNPNSWITDAQIQRLQQWVIRYYRDQLQASDLADPTLLDESRSALDTLTQILNLGSIYDFQR